MARDRILELQYPNSHSFVLRDIATNSAGQEYYLDMSNPEMAYDEGGVLFVNIGLMFDRYPTAIAIKLGESINAVDQGEWDYSPFDKFGTFIYDLDQFISVSYTRPYPPDFPNLRVFFDPQTDFFKIVNDSDNTVIHEFSFPTSLTIDSNFFEAFMVNGFDFTFGLSGGRFYMYTVYPSIVFYDLSAYYLKYGGFECPECPPAQNYSSLDGNGSEFLDGDRVVLKGRENVIYTVSRSFIAVVSDSNYTILYDLVSSDGYKVTCPEALLTLYVAPVVTTP